MSIYATLWTLQFPATGDDYIGCDWVEVIAQGVPPHIGSPTPGCGYEAGDPFGEFLPPPVETDAEGQADVMRAVVFVRRDTPKGTARGGQEYIDPLLVLTGREYAAITFAELHERLCDALRGSRPRAVAGFLGPDGQVQTFFDDDVPPPDEPGV
ncbi:MAG: hypothetical protein AB1505_16470 [Candidatus Latescibacterota bacterium]